MANPNPTPPPAGGGGRKKGVPNKGTVIRDALTRVYQEEGHKGEVGFWMAVGTQAKGGCLRSQEMIADRIQAKLKSIELKADVDVGRKRLSPTELRERVIAAIASGDAGGVAIAALLGGVDAAGGTADGGDTEPS